MRPRRRIASTVTESAREISARHTRSGASRSRPPRPPHDANYASWASLASPRSFDKLRIALSEVERRQNASRLNVSGRNVLGPHPKTSVMAAPRFVGILARTTQVGRPRDAPPRWVLARNASRCLLERAFDRADTDLLQTNGAEAGTGPV